MFNIADIPDLKLIQIENATPLTADVRYTHTSPPGRLCFLFAILVAQDDATGSGITNIIIDDEVVFSTGIAGTVGGGEGRWFINRLEDVARTAGAVAKVAGYTNMFPGFPFRKTFSVLVTGGPHKLSAWAFVHQDRKKEFEAQATRQGQ